MSVPDVIEWEVVHKTLDTDYEIGGVKIPMHIECEASVQVETWLVQNSGAMEDAVEGDVQVTVESVEMDVCLYTVEDENFIQFFTNSMSFFENYFDIDSMDLQ